MQCPVRGTNKERSEQGKCTHVHLGTSQSGSSMTSVSLWVTVSPPSIKKCVALLNFSYFICIKVERCYCNIRMTACGLQELHNHQLCIHICVSRKFVTASVCFTFCCRLALRAMDAKCKFLFVALRPLPVP